MCFLYPRAIFIFSSNTRLDILIECILIKKRVGSEMSVIPELLYNGLYSHATPIMHTVYLFYQNHILYLILYLMLKHGPGDFYFLSRNQI